MKEILKLNAISPLAEENLGEGFVLTDSAKSPVGIILRSFSMHGYDIAPSVVAVARAGAGTNNIPVAEYTERGIAVLNTPGANANAVKELCLAALFMCSRGITDGIKWVNALDGDDVAAQAEKGKKQFAGNEIAGKTLGVIGLGAIGIRVGNNAVRLGMNVLGYDPYITVDSAWKINHNITKTDNLGDIFSQCDYITLHVPLNDRTREMIDAAAIAKMKNGVNIINLARGELCVNSDILEGVRSGKIHAYFTDFAAKELLNVKGVTVLPHLGASTEEAEDNCAAAAARALADYINNGNIADSVNFPSCSSPRAGKCRITVIHRNVKSVLKTITDIISDAGINIENLVSRSRGDYAYDILDLGDEPTDGTLARISACDNIIRLRKL